jgi:hypothetical protein
LNISNLFIYLTDMCWNGQGTTILSHDLKWMYTILYLYLLMPRPKRVTNSFWIIIFMWSMRRLDMYAQESPFFFFWVGGEGRRGGFVIPNVFPFYSHWVPKGLPSSFQYICNSTTLLGGWVGIEASRNIRSFK